MKRLNGVALPADTDHSTTLADELFPLFEPECDGRLVIRPGHRLDIGAERPIADVIFWRARGVLISEQPVLAIAAGPGSLVHRGLLRRTYHRSWRRKSTFFFGVGRPAPGTGSDRRSRGRGRH